MSVKAKTPKEFASESPALARICTSIYSSRSRFHDGRCLRGMQLQLADNFLPSLLLPFQAVAKTSAAPIERIKLLIQNQDEMVRFPLSLPPGRLAELALF